MSSVNCGIEVSDSIDIGAANNTNVIQQLCNVFTWTTYIKRRRKKKNIGHHNLNGNICTVFILKMQMNEEIVECQCRKLIN